MRREAPGDEPIPEQGPQGREQVLQAYLLALGIGPPLVGDRDLVQPRSPLDQLRGQLRLQGEPVRRQRHRPEDVGPDQLGAGLHVGQVDVVQDVAQPGQKLVAQCVPEVQDAPVTARQEPGAEDRIGYALEHRTQQRGVVGRVVLQVGVLDEGQIARHRLDGRSDRARLALVLLVEDVLDAGLVVGQLGDELPAAVGRAVVHDHQLDGDFHWGVEDPVDDGAQGAHLVVDRHQHAQFVESGAVSRVQPVLHRFPHLAQ